MICFIISDILGDGTIHPVDLIKGPAFLIGYNANELGRLNRRLRFEGRYLADNFPSELEKILKRIKFLREKNTITREENESQRGSSIDRRCKISNKNFI